MSYWDSESADFGDLKGKVLKEIKGGQGDGQLTFITEDGETFNMYHDQDCCESVYIESIVGDLQDLIGEEIFRADEETQDDPNASECGMWTFYKLATRKGYVDIRWYGSSNGYYGVGVSFYKARVQ